MNSGLLLPNVLKFKGHGNASLNGTSLGVNGGAMQEIERPVGLQNLGNTCYLNCILQAIASCPPFRSYLMKFKERQEKFRSANIRLAPTLLKCITDVRFKKAGTVNSRELLDILSEKNNDFGNFEQQDAHELFQMLLSLLTEEGKQFNVVSLRSPSLSLLLNGKKPSLKQPDLDNTGSIKCPLQGTLGSQLVCQTCNTPRPVRHQQYLDLTLPIPSILRGTICLDDCFNEFFRGEQIESVECPACTVTSTASRMKEKVAMMEKLTLNNSRLPTPTLDISAKEELRTSKYVLRQLNNCCMVGESDSLVMDIEVDNWKGAAVKSSPKKSNGSGHENGNANGNGNGHGIENGIENGNGHGHGATAAAAATTAALEGQSAENMPTAVDLHLIDHIRTSVRKSMYLMALPELLCVQINRLVYNPRNGRKMKLPQHVKFPMHLDVSGFQLSPGEQRSRGTSETASTKSSPIQLNFPSGLSSAGAGAAAGGCASVSEVEVDDVDDSEVEDIEPQAPAAAEESTEANGRDDTSSVADISPQCASSTVSTPLGTDSVAGSSSCGGRSRGLTSSMMSSSMMSVSGMEEKKRKSQYDLCAVIIHSGSADGGHYTTVCKIANKWYHISDESISPVSEENMLKSQAYMLFYCNSASSSSAITTATMV